jgi:hypothetical protein
MSTMTTSLKAKGFSIPSAVDYSKVINQICSDDSNAFARNTCGNCGGCSSCNAGKRGSLNIPRRQSLNW